MKQRIFITGITGFAGSHLADHLVSQNKYDIYGSYLHEQSLKNIVEIRNNISLFQLDLTNEKKVSDILSSIQPDLIYHLAALPAVGGSLDNPKDTIMNNIVVQLNILECVRKKQLLETKILVVTSADIYGTVSKKDLPIKENTRFNPANAYAVSKITQDYLGLQYVTSYNLKVVRVRPFNHIGPRQSSGFVVADFAQKIVEIERGEKKPVLKVGNLETKRDFTDVRDMVAAYKIALEKGKIGDVYNIGSGVSHKISDVLNILSAFSKVKIKVEVEPDLLRPQDSLDRYCDNTKFVKLTGWKPSIYLNQSLEDTLDYWRNLN